MSDLHEKNCIPCRGGVPPFDISEIHKYLKKIDGWDVKKDKSESYFIEKEFKFKNFLESQNFINKVGEIAEAEGHHPDLWFGWGMLKLKYLHMQFKGCMRVILF